MAAAQRVFLPAPSLGWLSLVLLALLVLSPAILGAIATASRPELAAAIVIIAAALSGPLLVLAAFFPTMRYVLRGDTLLLRYGPLLEYRLPLSEIDEVERRDLEVAPWSAMRVPGLALFTVPYARMGPIRMCATRAAQGIVLIRIGRALYGVTPADEAGFIAAVRPAERGGTSRGWPAPPADV